MPKKKVLIIDDEADFCLLLKTYFVRKNFDVHISHTLQEGLSELDQFEPDIIFLDNNLPDGLGWEKTEFILKNHHQAQLNLISAYQYNPSLLTKFPTVRIWEKPISMRELNNYLS
ncbi:MAG: hypothetical protein C5B59_05940 [Bacteroidetes bacterium]|nr:MAG: hypothetical protein C5B59_05940 [Bacteroidota bacterium]